MRIYAGLALAANTPPARLTWWERITLAAVLVAYLLIGD